MGFIWLIHITSTKIYIVSTEQNDPQLNSCSEKVKNFLIHIFHGTFFPFSLVYFHCTQNGLKRQGLHTLFYASVTGTEREIVTYRRATHKLIT